MNIRILFILLSIFLFNTGVLIASPISSSSTQQESLSKGEKEVLAWLIVLNKNEIVAAKQALKENINPKIKQYAKLMIKDHSKNLSQTLKIIKKIEAKPIKDEDVIALQTKGKKELSELKPLQGKDFAKSYINDMVKGHTEALKILRQDLKVVHNPILKKHLITTQKAVKLHLKIADSLKEQLN